MQWLRRHLKEHRSPAIAVLLLLLLTITATAGLFERAELAAYDAWFNLRGARPADDRVVIIGIDDTSLTQLAEEYGRFPWKRKAYADLLEHLGQAKVVGFDILLAEPHDDDALLAEAIAQHGRVVMAAFVESSRVHGQINQKLTRPTPTILEAVRAQGTVPPMGVVNTPEFEDAVVRAMIPVDDTTGRPEPSLALAVLMAYKSYSQQSLQAPPFQPVQVGDLTVQRNAFGHTLLDFAGPVGTFTTYSFADVLRAKVPPVAFRDKIVLVGATATGLMDTFPTPHHQGDTRSMPGVEIHVNAVVTYLDGLNFNRLGHGYNLLIMWVLGLLVVLTRKVQRVLVSASMIVGLVAFHSGAVMGLWWTQRLWVDAVTPVIGIFFIYLVVTLDNYLFEQAAKRQVQQMFGRYVSHNVVEALLKNPEMAELGGRTYEVTVLFSDIRGFTTFSESREPREVLQRINEYCEVMVDIIYRHGGTLDKYMGDGIMAYFGAPVEMPDHAERALRCAFEMREAMKRLHVEWTNRGVQTFKIGVGLNSGEVVAGNVGHPDRMEYSLIGATVNLAARLESMTKEYAQSEYGGIVFSESTYRMAPKAVEEYGAKDVGDVEVRGMVHRVRIFTV